MKRFHAQKLKPLLKMICTLVSQNEMAAKDPEYLYACLVESAPIIKNHEKCFNCGGSMEEYIFEFDTLDALMLLEMAKLVKKSMYWNNTFTIANRVHVPSMKDVSYAMKSRTTQLAKLGLIAKALKGKHQERGMWVITRRGWQALRGEKVPKTVVSYHGTIQERPDEETTILEAFQNYIDWTQRYPQKKHDYIINVRGYNKDEWAEFGWEQPDLLVK